MKAWRREIVIGLFLFVAGVIGLHHWWLPFEVGAGWGILMCVLAVHVDERLSGRSDNV